MKGKNRRHDFNSTGNGHDNFNNYNIIITPLLSAYSIRSPTSYNAFSSCFSMAGILGMIGKGCASVFRNHLSSGITLSSL